MWIYKILIYGGVILKKAMIYVHGKGGSYLEAEQFKNICLAVNVACQFVNGNVRQFLSLGLGNAVSYTHLTLPTNSLV